jgi:hypothetical protein
MKMTLKISAILALLGFSATLMAASEEALMAFSGEYKLLTRKSGELCYKNITITAAKDHVQIAYTDALQWNDGTNPVVLDLNFIDQGPKKISQFQSADASYNSMALAIRTEMKSWGELGKTKFLYEVSRNLQKTEIYMTTYDENLKVAETCKYNKK